MNTDSTQNNLLTSAIQIDSAFMFQVDSLDLISDSLIQKPAEAEAPKRFITEKDVIKDVPESSSLSLVPGWITFSLLVAFVLLAIINFLQRKNLIQIMRSTLGLKQTNQLLREGNPLRKKSTYFLAIIYLISIPLLFYSLIEYYVEIDLDLIGGINLFIVIVLLLIGFFVYKIIFARFTAVLFQTEKLSIELLINILIFNLVLGALILPFITLFVYTQQFIILQIAGAIYAIGIVLRIFREIQVGLYKSIFSILHLFLYLCTLEFVPALIVSKIILNFYMQ